ncbi:PQQ-binding-like beta-propeller repeat protein [Sphingomonas quercus]|uniref:PQQ-binding-like beta-propeller repeat protein n=1 Tax=Sphingomonas quercus TaxID=2842451 RepID=A0ABS6BEP4_9SPHN|nr:PQQ-binding-like beta-propeller repeat protein [Sphingomonas quercus]MBU3076785.1 PQQ-binding-like beta-propeller repeat protein [Sphingomonas quercus]
MSRAFHRLVSGTATLLLAAHVAAAQAPASGQNMDWPTYNADLAGSRYRPLDQINAANFNELEVAWRFKTDRIGTRPEFKLEGTPLAVDGVVYMTAGTRRGVVALDGVTGEMLWMHSEREGPRGAASPRALSGRGLSYWTDGKEKRILYVTPGYRLVALDARNGQPVTGFGKDGIVDLKEDFDQELKGGLETGEVGLHSAPAISGNTIIIGAAFREGYTAKTHANTKGYVRGFDVRTGKRMWIFHTIPQKGEFGYDTWLKGSAEINGNAGLWTQVSIDPELNLAYLAVESATSDFYGGHRPGNGLFGNSLVAVDLNTGQRKWHYQLIHHEIWDFDNSSAPLLMNVTVDGTPRKVVALPSKQNFLYVFDRETGKPIWPINETKVEKGNVPGEWYSPTQPIPSRPPAYARNSVQKDDLIDFTPELRQKALELTKNYKLGPIFTPPVVSTPQQLGVVMVTASGGTNWPGGSFDPETGIAYVFACTSCTESIGLVPGPKDVTDLDYLVGVAGRPVTIIKSPGEIAGADVPPPPPPKPGDTDGFVSLDVEGMPLVKPPYSVISAIDVNNGTIKWRIPHGETPDFIRNHSALKGLNIPRTGQSTYQIGTLVTKSLVIAGDGQVTSTSEHPRGAMLRAYDKTNGKEVGAVFMNAPQSGSPMTYMVNGRQFIIVAISGGIYSGEYVAYTLPSRK